ncbi:ABC transporter ATP-binding protein [Roseivivax sediminis]|uniref:Peptide/nickel transport system ATP-binding protein n=1 Tax=Roseivivax sediminis TaxID=936889 RepID=A0A1I1VA46_9RHOB|nr:ABC transporter ATP-binding protein [Roseivivax sediminis]SFD79892.1 peptide/nickel transport system ATP-binding protein [Roseivivax sediminis]
MSASPIIDIRNLRTHFHTEKGRVTAVDDVSFHVGRNEVLGVVGESGCGKSVTSEAIMQLLNPEITDFEGEILFDGENLLALDEARLARIRGNDISMIFQDTTSSLNPLYTVGDQIIEALQAHGRQSRQEAARTALEMVKATGIPSPEKRLSEYPHELSGGMRQRIMIAMALVCRPRLLIADEPTTALDVTTQAQILDLIMQMKAELDMAVVFITHDIGVVAEICDRVAVMYLGQVIEDSTVESLFDAPLHPYTRGLMQAMPTIESDPAEDLYTIRGRVPSLFDVPTGCRFAERCPYATGKCRAEAPTLEAATDGHKVRCWHWKAIAAGEMTESEAELQAG